ncbi:glycosyltransferase family 9 protein [Helicobacter sp. 11S03491-1]|uniref:glycosyltransferase family 9 protein n=1 Tax=Helicobacter sp. 11S03491-1 TaxID=1476196 RepID=UPI000BA6E1A2|nr:glycosyltransferase family 9 protein [Helicobacter sp. 11S03491-1]PAF41828.1 hypothetical protein BKH45_05835 [Helicobacter sp. 11S03491-1]
MKRITIEKFTPIKIILFRTDRLGDTVLSLECIEAIKSTYPKSYICFGLQSYTAPLVENNPFLDEVICVDMYGQKELVSILKSKNFDISISLFASKIACYAPFFAKIPIRIGPLSKIRGLLFTHKIYQKRSKGEKNEGEYNLDLLKPLNCEKKYFPKIYLTSSEKQWGKNYITHKFIFQSLPLIIIHPGSGGSSRDWKVQNYFSLAQTIIKNKIANILITGSSKELENYANILKDYPLLQKNHLLENQKPLREFLSIITHANIFMSNSTGPLHCASALGCKTIGFYPLNRTCSPKRWGVMSENPNDHLTLSPKKENFTSQICGDIPFQECMELITIEDALQAIKKLI